MAGPTLTRIKNNQILDSTIYANAKIVPGSIVGSLFNANLTMTSDVTITGNLTVQGASTYLTVASTNTYVNDPLIVLNNAFSGTNTYDLGFVFNRGSLQNTALIWNEFNKEFRLVGTTETGTTYGNINQSNDANLRVGNLNVTSTSTFKDVSVTGSFSLASLNVTGNILASTVLAQLVTSDDLTVGNIASGFIGNAGTAFTGASINLSGNILTSTVGASYVTASTATFGNVAAVNFGNASATFTGASINVSGNVVASTVLSQLVTSDDATFGNVAAGFIGNTSTAFTGASINLSGNVLASTVGASYVTASTAAFGNIAAVNFGNASATFTGASINLSGNVVAATVLSQLVTADDATFGNVAAGFIGNTSTAFTGASINLSGNILSTTGVFNALTVNGTGAFTTLTATGNVIGGLASFASINATPVGNTTAASGAFTTLSAANSLWANASISTTAQGIGAIVVPNGGISVSGAANVGGTLTAGGATQLNSTLGVGGITTFTNLTNPTSAADGAVIIQGGASIAKDLWVGGNLYAANIIGVSANVITVQDPLLYLRPATVFPYNYDIGIYSAFTGSGLSTLANVYQHTAVFRDPLTNIWTFASNLAEPTASYITLDSSTVYDPIKAGNLSLVNGNPATNATSGALQVLGGAGITGALYVGSGIQNTPIGNATASTGAFTSITGSSLNVTGNVSASQLIAATLSTRSGYGNIHLTQFASIFAQGNNSENQSIIQLSTTGLSDGMGMWGVTGLDSRLYSSRGIAFATGLTMRDQDTPTGGVIKVAITAAGDLWANATTPASNTTTGALVVAGGVGIGGNLYVGAGIQNTAIGNTTASTGAFTSLSASGVTTLTGNLSLSATSNIIAGGTAGTNGQVLQATGTGVSWVTLGAVSNKIYQNGSNVTVETSYVNVAIGGTNVAVFRAEGFSGAIGAYSANTAQFTTLSASQNVTFNNYTGYLKAAGGSPLSASGTIPNTDITGLGTMSTQNSTSISVSGGTIDGTTIGSSTASSGKFTTLEATQTGLFNSSQGSNTFTIKGISDPALFLAIPGGGGLDTVIIGGAGNTTPTYGIAAKFGGGGGIQLPFGTTAQRPSNTGNIDLVGMLRFNTSAVNLEYYDGSAWKTPGSGTQVITDQNINGDGTSNVFILSNTATTNTTLVTINGVLQVPVLAYSISGNVLTFTEAPATGDLIDVRVLSTTTTISSLASANGFMSFDVSNATNTYANITAGAGTPTVRVSMATDGTMSLLNDTKVAVNGTAYNIAANNTPYTIDTFIQSLYTTAEYKVTAKRGTGATANIESYSATVITDGAGTAYVTTYGIINNGYAMGTLSANVLAGNVQLYYTGVSGASVQANVKIYATYIV